MTRIEKILDEVSKKITPSKEEVLAINTLVEEFLKKLQTEIAGKKIDAEIFVGGSFAKNTVIKKGSYDVDIFLRFDKKYEDKKISLLAAEILDFLGDTRVIHGSRDYFKIKLGPNLEIELVPVKKVKEPKNAQNITDLSYSHVKYIRENTKTQKILRDIRLAKAFCHANNCYGAESYINGFSGYALELLVIHFGGFLKMLRALSKVEKKLVIDMKSHHKNNREILMNLNSAKLQSPIILIDPTYKNRNALAALKEETFNNFKKTAKKFLINPNENFFKKKAWDLNKVKKSAKDKRYEFILIEAFTNKQEGDVAGSKLNKFYRYLKQQIERYFQIKGEGFVYYEEKDCNFYFVVKNKGQVVVAGPSIKEFNHVKAFKKKHKKTFIKNKKIFSKEKFEGKIENFVKEWQRKNENRLKEMYITEMKIISV